MLIDFQQALIDITASPRLCQEIRQDSTLVDRHYRLTSRERRQLLGTAHHPGMDCNCSLYRMNRVAPLLLNLGPLLHALRDRLEPLLTAYWEDHPMAYSHGYIECERFCRWLRGREGDGTVFHGRLADILLEQEQQLRSQLEDLFQQPSY